MKKIKAYKKIPCLFGRHKQAEKPLRLKADKTKVPSLCTGEMIESEWIGQELYFCERCHKILMIGHFPPHHPNCEHVFNYLEEEAK